MLKAVFPGSFDPVTNGHIDILTRAAVLCDELVVAVLVNESKRNLFTVQERLDMLERTVTHIGNVTVASFEGLLVDFCRAQNAAAIVKGMRGAADFDYEVSMAQMNERLGGVQTVFLPTSPDLSFVASSLVKEVARLGGDVAGIVPACALDLLRQRFGQRQS